MYLPVGEVSNIKYFPEFRLLSYFFSRAKWQEGHIIGTWDDGNNDGIHTYIPTV